MLFDSELVCWVSARLRRNRKTRLDICVSIPASCEFQLFPMLGCLKTNVSNIAYNEMNCQTEASIQRCTESTPGCPSSPPPGERSASETQIGKLIAPVWTTIWSLLQLLTPFAPCIQAVARAEMRCVRAAAHPVLMTLRCLLLSHSGSMSLRHVQAHTGDTISLHSEMR